MTHLIRDYYGSVVAVFTTDIANNAESVNLVISSNQYKELKAKTDGGLTIHSCPNPIQLCNEKQ